MHSLAPFKANIYVSAVLVDAVGPSRVLDHAVKDAFAFADGAMRRPLKPFRYISRSIRGWENHLASG